MERTERMEQMVPTELTVPMVKMALLRNSRFKMTIGIFHTTTEILGINSARLLEVMDLMVLMGTVSSKVFQWQMDLCNLLLMMIMALL